MRISIGSDHRGIDQRQVIAAAIESAGHQVDDYGTFSTESCDYPDIAYGVATKVAAGECQLGVLVCGTGIGMSIAANKIAGIRAAVCCDQEMARLSRQHNNANILCLSSEALNDSDYERIVTCWLGTDFEGGRHARRVDKITKIENGILEPEV